MVGFDIARDRPARKLRVFQTNYVCELYKKYLSSQCSKDFTTPVQSSRCPEFMAMTGATCEEDDRAVADKPFLPLMGGLNWVGWTRPDIKFYNARLCCFMHRPKIENYEAALAVLSYLYTTRDLGLEFSASSDLDGVVYCDSSYNQIPDTFYGHGVWYGGAPVASCSRVLRLGAQSSYESESFAYTRSSSEIRPMALCAGLCEVEVFTVLRCRRGGPHNPWLWTWHPSLASPASGRRRALRWAPRGRSRA